MSQKKNYSTGIETKLFDFSHMHLEHLGPWLVSSDIT